MKIDPKFTHHQRPASTQSPETAARRSGDDSHREPSRTPSSGVRTDSVELSARGRALADVSGSATDRMAEIRSRVQSRFYDDPSVAGAVAQRLHASGDV